MVSRCIPLSSQSLPIDNADSGVEAPRWKEDGMDHDDECEDAEKYAEEVSEEIELRDGELCEGLEIPKEAACSEEDEDETEMGVSSTGTGAEEEIFVEENVVL